MHLFILAAFCSLLVDHAILAQPTSRNDDQWYNQEQYPPQPYAFGYEIRDFFGNQQYRKEMSDGNRVTGSYGYMGPDGIYRHVEYIADELGYRAKIRTSEPGVVNEDPADVKIESNPSVISTTPPQPGASGRFGGSVSYDGRPPPRRKGMGNSMFDSPPPNVSPNSRDFTGRSVDPQPPPSASPPPGTMNLYEMYSPENPNIPPPRSRGFYSTPGSIEPDRGFNGSPNPMVRGINKRINNQDENNISNMPSPPSRHVAPFNGSRYSPNVGFIEAIKNAVPRDLKDRNYVGNVALTFDDEENFDGFKRREDEKSQPRADFVKRKNVGSYNLTPDIVSNVFRNPNYKGEDGFDKRDQSDQHSSSLFTNNQNQDKKGQNERDLNLNRPKAYVTSRPIYVTKKTLEDRRDDNIRHPAMQGQNIDQNLDHDDSDRDHDNQDNRKNLDENPMIRDNFASIFGRNEGQMGKDVHQTTSLNVQQQKQKDNGKTSLRDNFQPPRFNKTNFQPSFPTKTSSRRGGNGANVNQQSLPMPALPLPPPPLPTPRSISFEQKNVPNSKTSQKDHDNNNNKSVKTITERPGTKSYQPPQQRPIRPPSKVNPTQNNVPQSPRKGFQPSRPQYVTSESPPDDAPQRKQTPFNLFHVQQKQRTFNNNNGNQQKGGGTGRSQTSPNHPNAHDEPQMKLSFMPKVNTNINDKSNQFNPAEADKIKPNEPLRPSLYMVTPFPTPSFSPPSTKTQQLKFGMRLPHTQTPPLMSSLLPTDDQMFRREGNSDEEHYEDIEDDQYYSNYDEEASNIHTEDPIIKLDEEMTPTRGYTYGQTISTHSSENSASSTSPLPTKMSNRAINIINWHKYDHIDNADW